ncbi:hypothetical protein BDQ12DRAFT_689844 [Crucibulum laeve]|uniref:3-oxo-5-alpha-steroid 4-dehydrogenase C-terminal domain-containing protein n=1 Tax=Crucibulum laeve TaxID=68775 RepID=A0A5C3LNF8_9AGAR|nr:hypothetical protein BDQ12DRAFT_689844 [Crucibulum laeve]
MAWLLPNRIIKVFLQLRLAIWITYFRNGSGSWIFNDIRKWFTLSLIFPPLLLLLDIPPNAFLPAFIPARIDHIKSVFAIELIASVGFLFGFLGSPLSYHSPDRDTVTISQHLLIIMYLAPRFNHAVIGPLRARQLSPKSETISVIYNSFYNIVLGFLIGAFLASPLVKATLSGLSLRFLFGFAIWALGFKGKLMHDEILLNIERRAISRAKDGEEGSEVKELHATIPQGVMFQYVSFPNLFCELVQWLGFAIVSSPFPFDLSSILSLINLANIVSVIQKPSYMFAPHLSPSYVLFMAEAAMKIPRALNGHKRYRERFGPSYPTERKAIIPFVV